MHTDIVVYAFLCMSLLPHIDLSGWRICECPLTLRWWPDGNCYPFLRLSGWMCHRCICTWLEHDVCLKGQRTSLKLACSEGVADESRVAFGPESILILSPILQRRRSFGDIAEHIWRCASMADCVWEWGPRSPNTQLQRSALFHCCCFQETYQSTCFYSLPIQTGFSASHVSSMQPLTILLSNHLCAPSSFYLVYLYTMSLIVVEDYLTQLADRASSRLLFR